ncbi:hypothetical protein D7V89_00325 [Bifidobacterium pseudolongum]|uniref:Uncharacterized protein n=1 Tax=Bifidobacterium pseudolongum TaxID=1694 RepID=A0AB37NXZ9_9BIFI|nr:hypothetical protein [Bifidobacterium pseudolongum]RKI88802.1 hypothetical protein D7V89_00080 [Bifidobacterium pseudolongum]RKI88848.1 hypothetical protein D7V89_00325 [Bifidobacterium pseudolongum]
MHLVERVVAPEPHAGDEVEFFVRDGGSDLPLRLIRLQALRLGHNASDELEHSLALVLHAQIDQGGVV